ncbi:ATP-binding protein, partial [Klebsiella pneumoniae]
HRVVQNLVGNAVRYCDDKVLISGGVNDEGMAYICVEDDGPGIPEEDRKRIFDAFARLDDSRTRASGGYGLGLSIVSRIAYWFGGTVGIDESPT